MNRNLVAFGLLLICMHFSVCHSAIPAIAKKDCGKCQLPWITLMEQVMTTKRSKKILQPSGGLCSYGQTHLFTSCGTGKPQCGEKRGVPFRCCPQSCLPLLKDCLESPTSKVTGDVCIPTHLIPWQVEVMEVWRKANL